MRDLRLVVLRHASHVRPGIEPGPQSAKNAGTLLEQHGAMPVARALYLRYFPHSTLPVAAFGPGYLIGSRNVSKFSGEYNRILEGDPWGRRSFVHRSQMRHAERGKTHPGHHGPTARGWGSFGKCPSAFGIRRRSTGS